MRGGECERGPRDFVDSRVRREAGGAAHREGAAYTGTRAAVVDGLEAFGMDRWRVDDAREGRNDTADVWYVIHESTGVVDLRSADDSGHCTTPGHGQDGVASGER
ncbi:hypothetical protein [Streptomyces sp. NPDC058701]|uniref:hypothetical protein n=1 Tax=Streptomyces sp. NPDC058701 TaxID=3346608 RepID=UPI00365AD6AF